MPFRPPSGAATSRRREPRPPSSTSSSIPSSVPARCGMREGGRLQFFNNWAPYMVAAPGGAGVGLEYFCNETDELWRLSDGDLLALAGAELEKLGMIEAGAVQDGVVIRHPKTYPAYFGTYPRFSELRRFLDGFENLFLVGRNGMHKYNNQDHAMLTAMIAVDGILAGSTDKSAVSAVHTEDDYHEGRSNEPDRGPS